ncbi:hypothetical protein PFTANZ_02921 [Plasmodium falciparum Tanzania (2000708)]|uniref:Uncharacterized protein n=1 Tax=Plasmodium falciparum Tanzania (2000708) TaxID=1036725 RepID=A0A024W646_PLAFA|nr:hypothetical protein PFTANZ_02921 [Plasmodium falciparum Tanzania (2000708)]
MSDSAQVFMDNVYHLTGYLHRLLFLMKELDKKEHKINIGIERKEEVYLEKLYYAHKNKLENHIKHNYENSNTDSHDSHNEDNNEKKHDISIENVLKKMKKKILMIHIMRITMKKNMIYL